MCDYRHLIRQTRLNMVSLESPLTPGSGHSTNQKSHDKTGKILAIRIRRKVSYSANLDIYVSVDFPRSSGHFRAII